MGNGTRSDRPRCRGLTEKPAAWFLPAMTVLQGVALFIAAYLLLLGRNAWKQGELRQYLGALAMAGALVALIAASVFVYDRLIDP